MYARDLSETRRAEEERVKLIREQTARAAAEASERRTAFLAEAATALAASLDYAETLAKLAHLAVPALGDWAYIDVAGRAGRRAPPRGGPRRRGEEGRWRRS